jgi:hypothetical protein
MSVSFLVYGAGFAEDSFCEISRYRLSLAEIMHVQIVYIADWNPVLATDFSVD